MKKAKLVRESLNEGVRYPELLQVAKKLETTLGVKLVAQNDDSMDGYLGYELKDGETEAMGLGFDVIEPRTKKGFEKDYPLALTLDTEGGFQFWGESSPISTSLNSEGEKRQAWQSLIPTPKPVSELTKEIYEEVIKEYREAVSNVA